MVNKITTRATETDIRVWSADWIEWVQELMGIWSCLKITTIVKMHSTAPDIYLLHSIQLSSFFSLVSFRLRLTWYVIPIGDHDTDRQFDFYCHTHNQYKAKQFLILFSAKIWIVFYSSNWFFNFSFLFLTH